MFYIILGLGVFFGEKKAF